MTDAEQAHKELHKLIWNCKCSPIKDGKYCVNCTFAIIQFLNKHGAGVLTRDQLVEDLQKEVKDLESKHKSLLAKHTNLTMRYNALKEKVDEKA